MIVLVTGASSGFGAAMARRFVQQGHRVIAAARRSERLGDLHGELGDALLPVTLDVTDKASIEAALANLPEAWKPVDVLINNAGLALGTEPAHLASLDEWETMIATNTTGLVTMTRALLPEMVARGIRPDAVTDQTSAHDPINGYCPAGWSVEKWVEMRERNPEAVAEVAVTDGAAFTDVDTPEALNAVRAAAEEA